MSRSTNHAGFVVIALLAACGGGDGGGSPDAPGQMVSTTFAWAITRQGAATTCAAVGATEIQIAATPENQLTINHTFQCVLAPGMLALPPGRYAISAELYDGNGPQRLGSLPAQAVTVPASGTAPTVQLTFAL